MWSNPPFYVTMSKYGQGGGGDLLIGIDGNAFSVVGFTCKTLKRRQIDSKIIEKFKDKCFDSEYDKLLHMCRIALDTTDPDDFDYPPENVQSLSDLLQQSHL